MSRQSVTRAAAISQLAVLFDRNGYVRRQNPARRKADGCMSYKKGDEVRLVANTPSERSRILQLLRTAGFKPGRPFVKDQRGRQYRVPLYGREQVARFLGTIKETKRAHAGRTQSLRGDSGKAADGLTGAPQG